MADLTITTKTTNPRFVTAPENLTIEKKGSVVINLKGEYDPSSEDMREYAVQSTMYTTTTNTITLDGAISITDKTTDPWEKSHDTYGLMVLNATEGAQGSQSNYRAIIQTDNASTIKTTRNTTTKYTANVYGIGAVVSGSKSYTFTELIFANGASNKFQDAITVSATNSNKTDAGAINAYGISAYGSIEFENELDAAIKVTATNKSNAATANGINGSALTFGDDIDKDITATATGAATSSATTSTKACALCATGAISIGSTEKTGIDLDGKITATATGNATLTEDKTAGYAGNASAYAIYGESLTIYGEIDKNITATASANSVTRKDKTVVGGEAEAYGIQTTGDIDIKDEIEAAVKATATAKANAANAYGIFGKGAVSVAGIDATITATANGADGNNSSKAYGISAEKGLAVTGDITKALTVTATSNTNKQASGFAAGGTAMAYGISGSSNGGVSISGKLAGAIKVTATGKANGATTYGLYASNNTGVAVSKGITGAITATATGTGKVGTDAEEEGEDTIIQAFGIDAEGEGGNVSITGIKDAKGNKTAIGGAITATATGSVIMGVDEMLYGASASAYAIQAKAGTVTIDGDITKAITAKATAKAKTTKNGDTNYGDATAYALNAGKDVTIDGAITNAVTATATANSVNVDGFAVSGEATAYGLNTTANLSITGTVKGAISATATAKGANAATAYGIQAGKTLSVSNLTAVTAKASGYAEAEEVITATAIKATSIALQSGTTSLGKITATATDKGEEGATAIGIEGALAVPASEVPVTSTINATATGVNKSTAIGFKGSIALNTESSYPAVMQLNVTATSKLTNTKLAEASSTAIALDMSSATADTKVTLKKSKLTAKSAKVTGSGATSEAYAIKGGDKVEYFELDSSTLVGDIDLGGGNDSLQINAASKITGKVDMGAGNDTLTLNTGAKSVITGAVDMGEGTDAINIYSGNQIKGDLLGVENWNMTINDASSKGTAMWEGANADITNYSLELDSAALTSLTTSGKSIAFTLMKDTDGTVAWSGSTTVSLKLDTAASITLNYNGTNSDDTYTYALKGITKGKTTTMQILVTKN